ncbi:MAG: MFS transporter, partial [Porticoccaceae bacterium]|nr:MFS transporter [Porticoccaceae bacterium]
LYALMLAAAGMPLYIHLPRFASVNLGVGLGVIATVLLAIRVIDLVQDPLIGWAIDRWPEAQRYFAVAAAAGFVIGFPLLFAPRSGPNVVVELVLILILLFTAYSLGMILLYGRSATLAKNPQPRELMTLASYREAGMLAGVVLAAIAPSVFVAFGATGQGYYVFGWFLGGIAFVAAFFAFPIWCRRPVVGDRISFAKLSSAGALRLLFVALINSLPVAVTST